MESNRKITDVLENTKIYFLEGHLLKEEKFTPTTIEKEYLKTGVGKSYKVIVFLISFVVIALASTLILTEFMVGRNIAVIVDINSFRTLDVAEIIQNIKDNQKELTRLKLNITSSESELNKQTDSIENDSRNMIARLNIDELGQNAYRIEIDRINKQKDRDIQEVIDNYESIMSDSMARIAQIEGEVKSQQDNLSTQRTGGIELSGQYRDIPIDPNTELIAQNEEYRQLINILSNEMIANRSNLDLALVNLDTLQSRNVNIIDLETQIEELNRRNAQLSNEMIANKSNLDLALVNLDTLQSRNVNIIDLETQIEELNRQNAQLSNENSASLAIQIEELNRRNAQLSNEYNAYILNNTVATNIVDDNKYQINSVPIDNIVYHRALEYLLLQRRDGAGYIISNNNNDDIDMFISSSYEIENGEKIFVFRGGKFLAELEIISNLKPLAKAKILRLVNGVSIIPFDVVLLSINE